MNEGQYNRVPRPAPQVVGNVPNEGVSEHKSPQSPKKNNKKKNILSIVAVVALSIFVILVVVYGIIMFNRNTTTSQISKDQYQAVFLNDVNGQIYFGKLSVVNKDYYKLTDIYYVRIEQVQPDKNNTQTQQNISLAKLGNEIHGPEDVMFINRDSVLFWENLKDDGQVVRAIKEYRANPNQQQNTNTNNSGTNNNTNTNTNTNNNSGTNTNP